MDRRASNPWPHICLRAEGMDGVLTEYIVLNEKRVTAAPKTLTFIEASTMPCAALTAWTALNGDRPYKKPVTKGDKILTLGTGGVSLFALLLAKAAGAEVIGTSSQDAKSKSLKELGATLTINYSENANWGDTVFEYTQAIKTVVNAVGGSAIDESIKAVGYGGEIAFMGLFDFTDKAPDYISLMSKGAAIRGTAVGSLAAHQDLVAFVDRNKIKPPVDKVFGFDEAKRAYQAAASRDVFGKVVIEIIH